MPSDNHDKNDIVNPFSPQHPAQPEYFADRKEELDEFRKMAVNSARLRIPAPANYAIIGTWGQGKTSLLYKFRQMVIKDLRRKMRCICIYFALSPASCKSWDAFTVDFLSEVKSTVEATGKITQRIKSEIGKWELGLNLGVMEAKRTKREGSLGMIEALQSLWENHLAPQGTQIAFILLDDLHYFPIQKEESAYLTLRTTFQELVNRKCNYALVITAPTLLFTEIADYAEPLTRFFKRMELNMFTFEDAKEAIDVRLRSAGNKIRVSDGAIKAIVQRTGGHPYLFMFTMHELLNKVGGIKLIGNDTFEKHWPEIERLIGNQIFTQKYLHASPTERKLMTEIAKRNVDLVSPGEFAWFKGASRLFSRLEEKELLIRTERGRYRLFHPLFAEYLKRQ